MTTTTHSPPPSRPLTLKQRVRCFIAQKLGRARLHLPGEPARPTFVVSSRIEARKICALDDEEDLLGRFLAALRPGDTVYDIGGNMGLYAIPSALKLTRLGPGPAGKTGRVLSFEPVPQWSARLRQNAADNGARNLEVHAVALSDHGGRAAFTLKAVAGSGMGSLVGDYDRHMPEERRQTIEVEVARADEYVDQKNLPPPNVVKIDVEGAEEKTLAGLGSLLADPQCHFVLVEVHTDFAENPEAVTDMLDQHGFSVERGPLRGSEYHLFATRPS